MHIWGVIPLSSYKTTPKQQLNRERWDGELNHLFVFVLSSAWMNDCHANMLPNTAQGKNRSVIFSDLARHLIFHHRFAV